MQNDKLVKTLRRVLSGVAKFVAASMILLAVGALIFTLVLYSGKRDMQRACALAPIGADVTEVKAALSQNGYLMTREGYMEDVQRQYILVLTRKGMGRYSCWIWHEANKVIGAEISFMD